MFSKRQIEMTRSNIFLKQEEIQIVNEFKYIGVVLDPTLSFKNHVNCLSKTVKFNLANFKYIRPSLSCKAARMFLHSMIFSHIECCFINWSLTNATTLKPIESLFKRALKIFDRNITILLFNITEI